MSGSLLNSQLIRFLVAGGLAAAANYGSRFAFSLWMPFAAAVTVAYLVGMTVAFLLMRQYVFNASEGAIGPQVLKFTLVNLLALAQTLIISVVLARWGLPALGVTQHVEAIAHFVGVAVPVFTSFVGHRRMTFRA